MAIARIGRLLWLIGIQSASLLAQEGEPSEALRIAVEEFRVQTAKLQGGGNAQASGSKSTRAKPAWHGRVYHNFRNNALDAIPHQIVQRGGEQRKLRRNQFGFNVTGPVLVPKVYDGSGKTFFTLSYEGMRESIGQTSLNDVPTLLERTGSWSHVVDISGKPLPIYDPLTTSINPDFIAGQPVTRDNLQYNRLQFPGNRIPVTRLDPVAQEALQYYPAPNANAGPYFRNNYFVVSQEDNRASGFIATVDHTFLEKNRVTVRMNRSSGIQGSAPTFLTVANPASPPTTVSNRGIRVEHIFTASAASINTFSLQLSSNTFERQAPDGPGGRPFPRYDISGYLSMGTNNPSSRNANNNYQLQDTYATRPGAHRLSISGNAQLVQINTYQPQNPEGRFEFTSGLTSLPGIINTGHGFASFLLGGASYAEQGVVISPSYFRWQSHSIGLNDQWQVTPSLTVTIGASLRVQVPRTEKYDRQSNISPAATNPVNQRPGALVAASQGGYGRAFQQTFVKVEPSLGIAWSVLGDNNTVLRLTYSRGYGGFNRGPGHFGTQAFNGTRTWLSENPQLVRAVVLADGFPSLRTFPDLRPESANGTVADWTDTTKRQQTYQFMQVSLQRQLAAFLILTAEFSVETSRNGNVGNNAANPNAIPLAALEFKDLLNNLEFSNALRPYPQYQNFNVNGFPAGRYHGKYVNIRLEKRTSGGLALSVSYNYQRSMDNYSNGIQDFYDLTKEWSRSSWANPHQVNFNFIYELPIGAGRKLLNSGWGSQVLGNWSMSGTGGAYSGSPIILFAQFNNTAGIVPNLRANVVPGVDPRVAHQSPALWFNPAAFVQPDSFTIGDVPRTHPSLRNPSGWNFDFTMTKRVPVRSAGTLEIIASMFNALNHANWNSPDNRIGPASAPNANAGRIIGSSGGRIVQLGLRLSF